MIRNQMNTRAARLLRRAIGGLILPLAAIGCQHSHVATTQVVVDLGNGKTGLAEVPAPEPTPAPTPQPASASEPAAPPQPVVIAAEPATAPTTQEASATAPDTQPVSEGMGQEVSQASTGTGHRMAEASRNAGHDVAQASRATYHAAANGFRAVGTGTKELFTNSAVPVRNTPPESLSAPVIDVDSAMQVRDWDRVSATYSSGATVAGTTGFFYRPREAQPVWADSAIDVPLFLVDTALLPFAFAKIPPWAPVEWKGATVEPTYTAVPPLPPE